MTSRNDFQYAVPQTFLDSLDNGMDFVFDFVEDVKSSTPTAAAGRLLAIVGERIPPENFHQGSRQFIWQGVEERFFDLPQDLAKVTTRVCSDSLHRSQDVDRQDRK